jgi:hypothetical protein
MKGSVLLVAALVVTSLVWAAAPPGSAAPGGDGTVVVKTFTLPAPDQQGMATVMCPTGTRATGGGAAPTPPASLTVDMYRVFYSAPVDADGSALTTDAGDVPRGWQVSVGNFGPKPQDFKAFVICSANSDAVLAASQPSPTGVLDVVVQCPAGSRAIGGGVGKINDTVIPGDTIANPMYQTGPVDSTLTFAGTQDGDVATGWRTVVDSTAAYGDRFFAVCSAQSDAVVRSASYALAMEDNAAGGTAVSCPAGTRALSGGQGNDGANDLNDRVALTGPFTSTTELNAMTSGQVPHGWSAYGQSSNAQARTNRVFAMCATNTVVRPPAPNTKITSAKVRPAKHQATFAFKGVGKVTRFKCELKKGHHAAVFKSCTSPKTYRHLTHGRYKFFVRAIGPGGTDPTPATYRFKI